MVVAPDSENTREVHTHVETHIRWVSVVEFHDPTLGIGKVFGQESTVVKWNYQILSLHQISVVAPRFASFVSNK